MKSEEFYFYSEHILLYTIYEEVYRGEKYARAVYNIVDMTLYKVVTFFCLAAAEISPDKAGRCGGQAECLVVISRSYWEVTACEKLKECDLMGSDDWLMRTALEYWLGELDNGEVTFVICEQELEKQWLCEKMADYFVIWKVWGAGSPYKQGMRTDTKTECWKSITKEK